MKDLAISSGSREVRTQDHKDKPLKEGANRNRKRRRQNNQDSDLPPSQDEANVHVPWLESIPERQYMSGEQRRVCRFSFNGFLILRCGHV